MTAIAAPASVPSSLTSTNAFMENGSNVERIVVVGDGTVDPREIRIHRERELSIYQWQHNGRLEVRRPPGMA